MKKNIFFITLISMSLSINCGKINFKNDSALNLFITDHLSFGRIIKPEESFRFNNNEEEFFIYQASFTENKEFKLLYRLKEKSRQQEYFDFSFYDISSKNIEKIYPKHFNITMQSRLMIEHEQQKLNMDNLQSFEKQGPTPEHTQAGYQQKKKSTASDFHGVKKNKNNKAALSDIPHKDMLDSIIAEYNKIQQQKHGGISDDMLKNMMSARR